MASEEYLLLNNMDFIQQVSAPYRKYFEADDLVALAREGIIRAYRGWKKAYYKFELYAAFVITGWLEESKPLYSRNFKVESNLSLDMRLPFGNDSYGSCFPSNENMHDDTLYLNGLFEKLEEHHRTVFNLYVIHHYDDKAIMRELNIPPEQLETIKKQVELRCMEYDPDIRMYNRNK